MARRNITIPATRPITGSRHAEHRPSGRATFFAAFAGLATMLTADNIRFDALPKVAMIIQEDREAFAGEALDRFVGLARAVGGEQDLPVRSSPPCPQRLACPCLAPGRLRQYAAWEKALTETSAFLRHMIGCMRRRAMSGSAM